MPSAKSGVLLLHITYTICSWEYDVKLHMTEITVSVVTDPYLESAAMHGFPNKRRQPSRHDRLIGNNSRDLDIKMVSNL